MNNDTEKLILDSLIEVIGLNCINEKNNVTKSKLVYPTTRNDIRRVSEQEARFIFVKNIESKSDFHHISIHQSCQNVCFPLFL